MKKLFILLLFTFQVLLFTLLHADWWVETSSNDWNDGYFWRTTTTFEGMKISEWYDWFSSSWQYRMVVSVYNGSSSSLVDYQIKVTTDTQNLINQGKMKSDCSDILVCDEDGKTIINHWRVPSTTGTKNTDIWIKIPSITAGQTKNIYIYYGNASTTTAGSSNSDRDAVFDLYEDWEEDGKDGQIDTTKWQVGSDPANAPFRIAISSAFPDGIAQDLAIDKYAVCNSTFGHAPTGEPYYGRWGSWIQITRDISYPSKLEYYGNAWSEQNADWLTFYLDNVEQTSHRLSGVGYPVPDPSGWQKKFIILSPGLRTLKWKFERDSGGDGGPNRGFVDLITITKYANPEPTVTVVKEEQQKTFYSGQTEQYPAAMYWSNILNTNAENSDVKWISWSYTGSATDIKVYMRSAGTTSFWIPYDSNLSTWTLVSNGAKPAIQRGQYFQYHVRFLSDGTTTPALLGISIQYEKPPKRPTEFSCTVISTSTLLWTWKDNDPAYPQETGYRIYSATRAIPSDGFITPSTTSYGLIKELPADTTYWYEENLNPNTPYGRFVVAYNSEGGNVATRLQDGLLKPVTRYTDALPPEIQSEYYFDDPNINESQPCYIKISTGVYYKDKYLKVYSSHNPVDLYGSIDPAFYKPIPSGNFTSKISSGIGTLSCYRVVWTTFPYYSWQGNEEVWYPVFTSTIDAQSGNNITKYPEILKEATFNSTSWYFSCASFNGDNKISTFVILGPYYFDGCPAPITDLQVQPSIVEEGSIVLTWTAPTADATENNLVSGKFIIKYQTALQGGTIDSDSEFNSAPYGISLTTSCTAGEKQRYSLTGLTPGTYYYFAIKSMDSEGNISQLSNSPNSQASKVFKVAFVTQPATFYVGIGGGPIEIKTVDSSGNELKLAQDTNIYLKSTSGNYGFAVSVDGPWVLSYVQIPKGSSRAQFFYCDFVSGNPGIYFDQLPSGWITETQYQTVVAAPASKFRILHDGSAVVTQNEQGTIDATDEYNNTDKKFVGSAVFYSNVNSVGVEPSSYTYVSGDEGVKSVTIKNPTPGNPIPIAGPSIIYAEQITEESYKGSYFTGSNIGYICGDFGTIRKTVDSGSKWISMLYGTSTVNGLYGIHFIDESQGWVVGKDGRVLKTINGGMLWSTKTISGVSTLYSVYFVNSSTGWVVGSGGKVYKTTDGGDNWTDQSGATPNDLKSVYFVDSSTGWVVGNSGTILKTTDSGETWNIAGTGIGSENLNKIKFFFGETIGFVVSSGTIYRTTDRGDNWSVVFSTDKNIYDISFVNSNNGYACGEQGLIIKTTNGGSSWVSVSTTTENFYSLYFYNSNSGFIFGSKGIILKTTDGGTSYTRWKMTGQSLELKWNGTIITPISQFPGKTQPYKIKQNTINRPEAVSLIGIRTYYPGSASFVKINVEGTEETGNFLDNYVQYVSVYRDNGNLSFRKEEETFCGQATFSGGVAVVNLSAQAIDSTTKYYFITYELPPDAPIGKKIGLKISYNAGYVYTGIPMAGNNLPYQTSFAEIVPGSCTVLVSYENLAPSDVPAGTKDVQLLKFSVRTDTTTSEFRGIKLERTGQYITDKDIDKVNVYKNFVDPVNKIGEGTFVGGYSTILFSQQQEIDSLTTKDYIITIDISPDSVYTVGSSTVTVGVRTYTTTGYFLLDVAGANGLSPANSTYASGLVRIDPAYDTISITPDAIFSGEIFQSESKAFLKLQVSIDSHTADWTKLVVETTGTVQDSDISGVYLYRDTDGDEKFYISSDTVIGYGAFSGGVASIVLSKPERIESVSPSYQVYFVVLEISKQAVVGRTVGVKISNPTNITLSGFDKVSSANFPMVSNVVSIADYQDKVSPTFVNILPEGVRVDESNVGILKMSLTTYCDAVWQELKITLEGDASTSCVKLIKLYKDADNNGEFSSSVDTLLAQTSVFDSNKKASLTFSAGSRPKITENLQTFFIVFDFDRDGGQPQVGKKVGIGIDWTDFLYEGVGNTSIQFGYFMSTFTVLLDYRTPSKPEIVLDLNPEQKISIGNVALFFSSSRDKIGFSYNSTAVNGIKEAQYTIEAYKINIITYTYTYEYSYLNSYANGLQSFSLSTSQTVKYYYLEPQGEIFSDSGQDNNITISNLNLKHNFLYVLKVKVVSTDGFTRMNQVPFIVDLTPPPAPNKPVHTSPGPSEEIAKKYQNKTQEPQNSYQVIWDAVSDEESGILCYELQERSDTSPVWVTLSSGIPPSQTEYSVTDRKEKKFYYYRVRAKNYAGSWGSFSDASTAAYLSLPGEQIDQLANYPNPFDSRYKDTTITYILRDDSEVTIRIFDLLGVPIKTMHFSKGENPGGVRGTNNITWDGTNEQGQKIVQGMYIMSVEVKSGGKTTRKNWKVGVIH